MKKLSAEERHREIMRIANKLPPGEREQWMLEVAQYDNKVAYFWAVLATVFLLAIILRGL